jgi:serine O-acetyltransferase
MTEGAAERGFTELVMSDLVRHRPQRRASWLAVLTTAPFVPGLQASLVLRLQQALVRRGWLRSAYLVRSLGITLVGADFAPGCDVGASVAFSHPVGVVLGPGCRVGDGVTFAGGVTLGVRSFTDENEHDPHAEFPVIADGVSLGANAVVLGGVTVGEQAEVGANSVVLADVPAGSVVAGAPARVVGSRHRTGV